MKTLLSAFPGALMIDGRWALAIHLAALACIATVLLVGQVASVRLPEVGQQCFIDALFVKTSEQSEVMA